ncbi:MAG: hypothetical protein J3R72DRAFT_461990 [Linnemannia gamsii]|nr:MAG: hypothetical protein J3R72DRAFT_461990 [Linnemannia gamsii]
MALRYIYIWPIATSACPVLQTPTNPLLVTHNLLSAMRSTHSSMTALLFLSLSTFVIMLSLLSLTAIQVKATPVAGTTVPIEDVKRRVCACPAVFLECNCGRYYDDCGCKHCIDC